MTTAQQARSPRKGRAKATVEERGETGAARDRGTEVPIPVVTPHLKVYKVHVPGGGKGAAHLPPPDRLAFYGGLGAMAAFNVISWPVAAAIGVGTAIAGRARRAGAARSAQQETGTSAK